MSQQRTTTTRPLRAVPGPVYRSKTRVPAPTETGAIRIAEARAAAARKSRIRDAIMVRWSWGAWCLVLGVLLPIPAEWSWLARFGAGVATAAALAGLAVWRGRLTGSAKHR